MDNYHLTKEKLCSNCVYLYHHLSKPYKPLIFLFKKKSWSKNERVNLAQIICHPGTEQRKQKLFFIFWRYVAFFSIFQRKNSYLYLNGKWKYYLLCLLDSSIYNVIYSFLWNEIPHIVKLNLLFIGKLRNTKS